MRRKLFLLGSRRVWRFGILPVLAAAGLGMATRAADAPRDAWPAPPDTSVPQVNAPEAPGESAAPLPQTPEALFPNVELPPTQAVPPGSRNLVGPLLTVAPAGSQFEVDAPDYESAYRVLEMCERMQAITAKFFTWPAQFGGRIRLQLVPAATADFSGSYVVRPGEHGQPVAWVRWSADLPFFDMCQAVSAVTLQNALYARNGAATIPVPDWLKLGFAVELEAACKPPLMDELTDQGHRFPKLAMRQIMTATMPTGPDVRLLAVNAFWLITFLNDQCATPGISRALFDALAAGLNPAQLLGTAFGDKVGDPRELELWWQMGYRDELFRRSAPFMTITETRELLDQLERVQIVKNNIAQLVPLDEAWDRRADKDLRAAIEKSLLAARPAPNRANPVYKNALVSLLNALDKMRGDDKKAFDTYWVQYQTDRAAGAAIENTVASALKSDAGK